MISVVVSAAAPPQPDESAGASAAGVCTTGETPQGRPRKCWSDYISHPALESLSVPLEELRQVTGGRITMT